MRYSFAGIGEGTQRTEETANKEGETDVIIFYYIYKRFPFYISNVNFMLEC